MEKDGERQRRFFFNDPATTEIYTLSLHDALPICLVAARKCVADPRCDAGALPRPDLPRGRSEEHTSELQSQSNLVCRLLLEKKKVHNKRHDDGPQNSRCHLQT